MECNTCGAHYMQNCSWWCGMSESEIQSTRNEYLMSFQVKLEIERIIHSLKIRQQNAIASTLQTLLNKSR